MKKYFSYFKAELMAGIQYRGAAISGLTTQFFWGIILIFVYKAFYDYNSIRSINYKELVSYVWLNQAFFCIIYINKTDSGITNAILDGTVAYELLRPYNVFTWWFSKLISKRYSMVILRCIPILIVSPIIWSPYNLSGPKSVASFLLFVLALFLGSIIVSLINVLVRSIAFYTHQDKGITSIITRVADFLAGFFLPIPLLPDLLIKITKYLPFRLIGDLPFRIYSGNINITTATYDITLQVIWIILLVIIGNIVLLNSLKKVSIQGG